MEEEKIYSKGMTLLALPNLSATKNPAVIISIGRLDRGGISARIDIDCWGIL